MRRVDVKASRSLWLLALATLIGCEESPKVAPGSANITAASQDAPSQVSYHTTMNFSSDGLLRARLTAGRVRTYDLQHYTALDSSVRVDLYDRTGRHASVLTSTRARVELLANDMTASGGVRIVSDSGTIVQTDSLHWDDRSRTIRSQAHVEIHEPNGRTTEGEGFESDQDLTHYHILRPTITAPAGTFESGAHGKSEPSNPLRPTPPPIPGSSVLDHPRSTPLSAPMQRP